MTIAIITWKDGETTTYSSVTETESDIRILYGPMMKYIDKIEFVNVEI